MEAVEIELFTCAMGGSEIFQDYGTHTLCQKEKSAYLKRFFLYYEENQEKNGNLMVQTHLSMAPTLNSNMNLLQVYGN